jgi:hypothetical protein
MLENLIHKFIQSKKDKPSNVNELLDFLQKEYVEGTISIAEYRNVYRELNERGAEKPSYTEDNPDQASEALAL